MYLMDDLQRFDMTQKPMRTKWYLRPVTWLISFPAVWSRRSVISKNNMDELKPPYLLLCNHNAFLDFKLATVAVFPHRANYIVAIDGFIGREKLMRSVGCICKRKFTNDILLVRQLQRVIQNGDIVVIYPEARYSLCGTDAVLPESLGKLVKVLKVPVVTLIAQGHHINSPFWNLHKRKIQTTAHMTQLITSEEISRLTVAQINERIQNMFEYDDYQWQKENGVAVSYKNRAQGLHKVLYQCANCHTEYRMKTEGNRLWCEACGKEWTLNQLNQLSATHGVTEFSHIPDWYEWERKQVRNEIKSRKYEFNSIVSVKSLPNADGFIDLGEGVLTHDMHGFRLRGNYDGVEYHLEIAAKTIYSCHIEYEYLGKHGDCIDLNTLSDTYYIYPKCKEFSVTKIALATEELYQYHTKTLSKEKHSRSESDMARESAAQNI